MIPKPVRERLRLAPGQKVQVLAYENRIELIPVKKMESMRGFLEEIDTSVPRAADRV